MRSFGPLTGATMTLAVPVQLRDSGCNLENAYRWLNVWKTGMGWHKNASTGRIFLLLLDDVTRPKTEAGGEKEPMPI